MIFSKDYSHLLLVPEGKEGAAHIPDQTNFVPALGISRCPGLLTVEVGEGGAAFSSYNGMLFTKNMKTLVAVPAGIGASVVLPAEVEVIGEYALAGCKNLASVTALGNVREIVPTAFADEAKATAVVALPAGEDYETRKSVWEQATFQHFAEPAQPGATTNPDNQEATTGLTYTLLDDYTLSVSWQGKDDPEANLEIPSSAEINRVPYRVSTIAENAFTNRGSLTSVKLPTTITTINSGAFAGCANLSTIEFPNTLRTISERAFEATSLKDIWLPVSIESIGSRAFASCSSLERIIALGTPEVANDALASCINVSIYVPSDSEDSWNPGLPSDNNHLMPYGVSLSEEPLAIKAGQEADLLEGGNLQAPDPIEASYSYAAAPLSVDAGTVSAKKAGTSDVTTVLSLNNVELARASRTVEVSPNPEAEANVSLLNSKTPLPSTYLADLRAAAAPVSVTAPIAVVFGASDGYDVSNQTSSVTADATFVNTSSTPAYIESLTCTDEGASSLLQPKSGSPALDTQSLFSLYLGTDATATSKAVNFGYGSGVNSVSPSPKNMFSIDGNSNLPCTFSLNLNNATVKTSAANGGATVQSLANVMYTYKSVPLGLGLGNKQQDFYLEDKSTGQVYTAAQVKGHANAIAGGNETIESLCRALMSSENTYECKTKWGGTFYDVRIIGINHDELASGPGKAGLTFQFKNLLESDYQMNLSNTNAGGWGSSVLQRNMNSEETGTIWYRLVPPDLQDQIATVKKKYQPNSNGDVLTITTSDDKLFLPSLVELRGVLGSSWDTEFPWTIEEGSQYEYYALKDVADGNNSCLDKGAIWWQRSISPNVPGRFLMVSSSGDPFNSTDALNQHGVCPCFCF